MNEEPAEQLEGERQPYEYEEDARLGGPPARPPPAGRGKALRTLLEGGLPHGCDPGYCAASVMIFS